MKVVIELVQIIQVETINLPSKNQVFKGTATISGWGLIDPTVRIPPNDLHIVDVPIVSDEDCAAAFGDASLITPQTICVGLGGVGACSVSYKCFVII